MKSVSSDIARDEPDADGSFTTCRKTCGHYLRRVIESPKLEVHLDVHLLLAGARRTLGREVLTQRRFVTLFQAVNFIEERNHNVSCQALLMIIHKAGQSLLRNLTSSG